MAIQQYYNLDLIPNAVPVVVKASQYDRTSRMLIFNIYKQGELFEIPSNSTVTIRGTKKDMTGFEYPCSYATNQITAVIEEQMTIFSGKYPVELRIAQGGQILGTANFILDVEESPLKDDTIVSETDLPLLEEAEQHAIDASNSALRAQWFADNAQQSAEDASREVEEGLYVVNERIDTIEGNVEALEGNVVNSFNGRKGAVVPSDNDYRASQVYFDTTVSEKNVASALRYILDKIATVTYNYSDKMTLATKYELYDANGKIVRTGNVVQLSGAFKNKVEIASNTTETIATINDSALRPKSNMQVIMQGTGDAIFHATIYTNGNIGIGRYRDGTGKIAIPVNSWLNIYATYIV